MTSLNAASRRASLHLSSSMSASSIVTELIFDHAHTRAQRQHAITHITSSTHPLLTPLPVLRAATRRRKRAHDSNVADCVTHTRAHQTTTQLATHRLRLQLDDAHRVRAGLERHRRCGDTRHTPYARIHTKFHSTIHTALSHQSRRRRSSSHPARCDCVATTRLRARMH
jgi:hypothetical protein